MKIALAQINTTIGDFEGNTEKIFQFIDTARQKACDLVVFPELAIPGYPPTDYTDKPDFVRSSMEKLDHIAKASQGIGIILGYLDVNHDQEGKPFYNGAALLNEGKIISRVFKTLLPSYDVFDENRYFQPGKSNQVSQLSGKRLGITICEDIWNDKAFFHEHLYSDDPVELLVKQGLDLLINISGSPFYLGKRDIRVNILTNLARKYHIPVVYVNLVGGNDSLLFDGGSMVIDPQGEIRASAKEFEEDLITFDVETNQGDLHLSRSTDEELIFKALCLGTRDYVSKCGFNHVALGLSGGIDSSLVACIAAQALGKANVLGVAMPSLYSSPASLEDAQLLAQRLGINFRSISISDIFQIYLKELQPSFAQYESDTTEENLQARIRGNLLMALANKFNALVLTTGNKSEMAVGYCTLYGDMCGALAVISDVPKTMVYNLARYLNRREEIIPARVITRPPSAELKPDQTDQDTLPPYDVLDDILTEYVEKNRSIADIIKKGHDPRIVQDIIRRIHLNEYKRKQAPPGLKVTTKAFGVGRRYPIAHRFTV